MSSDADRAAEVAVKVCDENALELGALVGQGSFKFVFSARKTDRPVVALKILLRPSLRDHREIEALQTCDHAHIAKLQDAGEVQHQGNRYFFCIEEFCGGGSLEDRIREDGFLTSNQTLDFATSVADALSHIHARLVHRDIKPANIMFTDDSVCKLTDFGLVRNLEASSLTASWAMMGPGTPLFASPEQLNNQKEMIDWRADQFGLGVTMAVAATGKHPYQRSVSGSPDETTVEAVAVREQNTDVCDLLEREGLAIVRKMTDPWPAARFRRPSLLLAKLRG